MAARDQTEFASPVENGKRLRVIGASHPIASKDVAESPVDACKASVPDSHAPAAVENAARAAHAAPSAGRAPSVPANLLLVRRARAVSRSRLAERSALPAQAIALFENGWVDLWPEDKAEIARVLEVPGAVLWGPSTDVLLAWLEREEVAAAHPTQA